MLARTARLSLLLAASVMVFGLAAKARADHPPAAPDPKPLQPLRKLVGTWQGNATIHDKTMPVTITYDATAGGTAIVEHLFPGTPHEMLSVYTVEGDGLAMTHYCTLGNHPKMALKRADAHSLSFEATGGEGLRSPSELHMHAMTLAWTDGDHIRETWTSFDQGKPKDEKIFDLTRKK
ncbi:MAG TPA: hypothetical protein VHO67_14440 [Polyangia bacterium]|nr:hypothetical protein [Polyangia bacterium]